MIWQSFKKDIAKSHLAKIDLRIKQLMRDLTITANMPDINRTENTQHHKIILEKEIDHLQQKRYKNAHLCAHAQWSLKEGKISKYWSKSKQQEKPRDVIYKLRIPDTNRLTSKSKEIVEVARNYHERVQRPKTVEEDNISQNTHIVSILKNIPQIQTFNAPDSHLHNFIQEEHVLNALQSSKAGSTTGIDGIPYKTWRALHEKHLKAVRNDKHSFNIMKMMTHIFKDIQQHGVLHDSEFTLG